MFYFKKACFVITMCALSVLTSNCKAASDHVSNPKTRNEVITINLDGTKNTRDLGGYKGTDGKLTKHKLFFRSDNTDKLTDKDIKKLKEKYNLKTVIDLRYDSEIVVSPDKLNNIEGIEYCNIPLYIPKEQMQNLIKGNIDLGDAYIESLNQKDMVRRIFETISKIDSNGSLLFHCTNGKDRTGTVAALLLGLCGVSDKDIVNNYSATYKLIKNNESVKKGIEKYGTKTIFKSSPKYMIKLIKHIKQKYGNVETYLLKCEVSQNSIDEIKNKFLESK